MSEINLRKELFMSDRFHPTSLSHLLKTIENELAAQGTAFGVSNELLFNPEKNQQFTQHIFNRQIDSPVGVAAGPHSQLAHNIVAAWLVGARYIELKTVQTLDEIEVAKPCIDMQDEGYNCEWSQELKINESFDEYLKAWIAVHYFNYKLNGNKPVNTIFNMSVGYDLKGILNENVQWFFAKMNDCTSELQSKIDEVKSEFPEVAEIDIPTQISDNITLSTMHGCPANEIEDIAKYLLKEKGLHTFVKLNPTLLGPVELRKILNEQSKFKSVIPDEAFGHDLKYADALKIISSLRKTADEKKLEFGLKLTNTLETQNFKDAFGNDVEMMYMSGRSLHQLSVNIACKLQNEFDGDLQLSFSGGADAFNVADLLAAGFKTVTVSSDLLKPGGYGRFAQYFDELHQRFEALQANDISQWISKNADKSDLKNAALANLNKYADFVLTDERYKRTNIQNKNIKTERELGYFDCISAPCRDTCATNQDIPDYLYYTAKGDVSKAYEVILRTNPFPAITGMVCDHLCQNKCTRVNYDDPLLIREVKRFVSEQDQVQLTPGTSNNLKVAIVGAGPSGLSAAYYLALAGFGVEVFERNTKAGGMVQYAIPGFRLTDEAIEKDFKRVTDLGVKVHYQTPVDAEEFERLQKHFNYVFVGVGAQLSKPLTIEGADNSGVLEPLSFLFDVKAGRATAAGQNIVIIGGGNTAMDAARTAYRVVGDAGKVTVVYRRTIGQMPADQGEIKAVLEEGIEVIELAAPEKIIDQNGRLTALQCARMELKGTDSSGRLRPVKVPGSEFQIACDTIIPAIGQDLDIDFINDALLETASGTYRTKERNIYIGGDALRGASTAINAIGDGRKAAGEIMEQAHVDFSIPKPDNSKKHTKKELMLKRARRAFAPKVNELSLDARKSFTLVSETLNKQTIQQEADRCLQCDEICNICTTVCPNFANYAYNIEPVNWELHQIIIDDDGKATATPHTSFVIAQPHQILNIANYCNECGNCTTFCPTNSAPYKEKPHIYLTQADYNAASEGFYLDRTANTQKLLHKNEGLRCSLTDMGDVFHFENENIAVDLDKSDFSVKHTTVKKTDPGTHSLEQAAIMAVVLYGVQQLVFE
jgi:putative selenate reductase